MSSRRAERDGHPRTPLPTFDSRPPSGQLRLLSPASEWLLNDSYGNDAIIRKTLGACDVRLCSSDARAFGLCDGDKVELFNDTGCLPCVLVVSDKVSPGVALSHKGRWPKLDGKVNVNGLNPGEMTDMGESSSVHGVHVQIRRNESPERVA